MVKILQITALIFLFTIQNFSQESNQMYVEGEGEYLPSEKIGKEMRDANGRVCAGLIILTDLTGLTYTSYNGIVKKNENPGKDFLFLSPGERVVEVYKSGFKPLKIILSEYDIDLESGETWQIEITGEEYAKPEGKGNFFISSQPEGAAIKIDGIPPFEEKTPYQSDSFNAQTYSISLSKEDYQAIDTLLTIKKDDTTDIFLDLTPKFGYITIQSGYEDFNFKIDGIKTEITPNSPEKVPTGKHELAFSKNYYASYSTTVTVNPNDDPNKSIVVKPNFKQHYNYLSLKTEPRDARVFLNREFVGNTPLKKKIPAGKYNLKVSKKGYRTYYNSFEITKDNDHSGTIKLSRNGIVNIDGTDSASVFIDDEFYGNLPLDDLSVNQGEHKIRVSADGYETEETEINVKPRRQSYEFFLTKSKGKFFRTGSEQRTGNLFNGGSIYFEINNLTINPGVVEEITGYNEKLKALNGKIGISIIDMPLEYFIDVGFVNARLKDNDVEHDTLDAVNVKAGIGWIPFLIKEKLMPRASIYYMSSWLDYTSHPLNTGAGKGRKDVIGYSLEIKWFPDHNYSLYAGYTNFLDNTVFYKNYYGGFSFNF